MSFGSDMRRVLEVIGENVDRLCSLELRPRSYSHGVIHPLYLAAREKIGEPLAMAAARRISEVVKPRDIVLLTTGTGTPRYLPLGETDGPLGTVALARMLAEAFGVVPVILAEQIYIDNIAATSVAAGLGVRSLDDARQVPVTTAILPFPTAAAAAEQRTAELLDGLDPKAVIAIEKLGPNAAGVAHSATGMRWESERAPVELLIDAARERGVLTIGIGDNGNEIGFGLIQEAVWEHRPFGRVCQCPCGEGMATRVATDVLVVAGTSNWGAYGIEACLAAIAGKPDLIHSGRVESFMLHENVRTGGVDGSTGRQVLQVDGTTLEVQLALNELLRSVVQYGLMPPRVRPF